jgi:acyl-CoA thioesterase
MPAMDTPPPTSDRPRFGDDMADVRRDLEQLFLATPMYDLMGIRLQDWGPGWATLTMDPTSEMANLAGSLHGGATFTLADAAFEIACNSHGRLAVALETSCHYHAPAPLSGTITADAWELSHGGRTASYRLQVTDAVGTVLASYLALAYRTSGLHVAADRLPQD